MVSAFLKYIDDQQKASAKQRTDNLALQQQQFANSLAIDANNRANTSAALTNKLNKAKVDEIDRKNKLRSMSTDVSNVLTAPSAEINMQEQKLIHPMDSNPLYTIKGATENQLSQDLKPLITSSDSPEYKNLVAQNQGHISSNELAARINKSNLMYEKAGASPTEASTLTNQLVTTLYGPKVTQKDADSRIKTLTEVYKATHPGKTGGVNIGISSDGSVTTGSKGAKPYTVSTSTSNFDGAVLNDYLNQASVKYLNGSKTLSPNWKLFDGLRKIFGGTISTSDRAGLVEGFKKANNIRASKGLPPINTSAAEQIVLALPRNRHYFLSDGVKGAINTDSLADVILKTANNQGITNVESSRSKSYRSSNNSALNSNLQQNKDAKALIAQINAIQASVGKRANVDLTGEATYNTSHLNRVLKDNLLYKTDKIDDITAERIKNPKNFAEQLAQLNKYNPKKAITIKQAMEAVDKNIISTAIKSVTAPKGLQTILTKFNSLDPKSNKYKYMKSLYLSSGNKVLESIANGTYKPAVKSNNTVIPTATDNTVTNNKSSYIPIRKIVGYNALNEPIYETVLNTKEQKTNDIATKEYKKEQKRSNELLKTLGITNNSKHATQTTYAKAIDKFTKSSPADRLKFNLFMKSHNLNFRDAVTQFYK